MRLRAPAFIVLVVALICACRSTRAADAVPQARRVNADAATLVDFTRRLTEYVALHKRLDATLKEVPRDAGPEQFIDHQRTLAMLIQQERAGAQQGDVCAQTMRDLVRRLLAGIFRGPDGRQIKRSILDEYTGSVRLAINGQYPEGIPVSTVPPQVLQALPKLPDVLEYRFIGKRLILLDTHARLIVDFFGRAFP
jgi:hypothetical protein